MTVLQYPSGKPINWHKPPKATTRVQWDTIAGDGKKVTGSLFAIACLDQMSTDAKKKFGQPVHVIQPAYNTGVAASAGTHDKDFCMDWEIFGVPWLDQQWFGRNHGWGCWWRHTGSWSSPSAYHIHGFPLPPDGHNFPTEVGIFVDGGKSQGRPYYTSQIADYWNRSLGLAGQHSSGADHTKFPEDIAATIFDLDAYIKKQQGADMSYEDWTPEGKAQFWADAKTFLTTEPVVKLTDGHGKVAKTVSLANAVQRDVNSEDA